MDHGTSSRGHSRAAELVRFRAIRHHCRCRDRTAGARLGHLTDVDGAIRGRWPDPDDALPLSREPIEWSQMERHLAVTQAFLPLGGVASIMVVAPPSDPADRKALPPPDSVRAFHMDGSRGVVLRRGTWHALRRF